MRGGLDLMPNLSHIHNYQDKALWLNIETKYIEKAIDEARDLLEGSFGVGMLLFEYVSLWGHVVNFWCSSQPVLFLVLSSLFCF